MYEDESRDRQNKEDGNKIWITKKEKKKVGHSLEVNMKQKSLEACV